MVDFASRLVKKTIEQKIHPVQIYDTLDRASDKGPLRPVQETILNKWFDEYQKNKDVILKLHTGQGKTLIGLLILQSRLNQDSGPALYLCPDKYLVNQTCSQADSFGINFTTIDRDLPDAFLDGKKILVTTVKKLFNAETKFGIGARSISVSTIIMDDAHSCIDYIKDSFRITLKSDQTPYSQILDLFGPELEKQAVGTYSDIRNGEYDSFLAVPYWDWQDKHVDVARILSQSKDLFEVRFVWPIIKDIIKDCRCIISGNQLEILPYSFPLNVFGSYYNAQHRVFMSATVNDDSFFIKGLGTDSKAISEPLCIEEEKWSGEKMVLIPSLVDETLDRTEVVSYFAKPNNQKRFGIVALVPSFAWCKDWEKYGAIIANKESIIEEIQKLKNKEFINTLVIVNRYDGIDLPDYSCRILIMDSKPFAESLEDKYFETCRNNSDIVRVKSAQTIEQGLGRAVRGEKDYCAIILTGNELIKIIRSKDTRQFFSQQTRTQVEIGLQIADFAKDDIKSGVSPISALINLINQLLKRDDDWKNFYTQNMESMASEQKNKKVLTIFETEKEAELKYMEGNISKAIKILQSMIDNYITTDEERGWYLQEMARYCYSISKSESNDYQIAAHKKNIYLFKPKTGLEIKNLSTITLRRVESIISWVQSFDNYEELFIGINSITDNLRFGVDSDKFEKALDDLAKALGFIGVRPDKEWNVGPDNLWKVNDNQYLLIECKNKVLTTRVEIHKEETGQMNNACAWFKDNYGDVSVKRIMIIPTKKIAQAAGFNLEVEIMRERDLKRLVNNVQSFFKEFKNLELNDLTSRKIQELLNLHSLRVDDILTKYSEIPKH